MNNDIIIVDYPDIIETQHKITEEGQKELQKLSTCIMSSTYSVSVDAIELLKKSNKLIQLYIPFTVDENIKSQLLTIDRMLKIKKIKNKIKV